MGPIFSVWYKYRHYEFDLKVETGPCSPRSQCSGILNFGNDKLHHLNMSEASKAHNFRQKADLRRNEKLSSLSAVVKVERRLEMVRAVTGDPR
jgi:hypothetical protein